mgnify:CR=1 FL=1
MVKKEFKIKEGTFTAYSKRKGKTVPQMTKIVLKNPSKYNTITVKRATLARNFSKMRKAKTHKYGK